MIGILETCGCGREFLRGIYPQQKCEICDVKIQGKGFAECFYCMGTGTATDEFGREGECAECGGMGEKIIESSFFDPTWAESKFDPFRKKCKKKRVA